MARGNERLHTQAVCTVWEMERAEVNWRNGAFSSLTFTASPGAHGWYSRKQHPRWTPASFLTNSWDLLTHETNIVSHSLRLSVLTWWMGRETQIVLNPCSGKGFCLPLVFFMMIRWYLTAWKEGVWSRGQDNGEKDQSHSPSVPSSLQMGYCVTCQYSRLVRSTWRAVKVFPAASRFRANPAWVWSLTPAWGEEGGKAGGTYVGPVLWHMPST